MKFTAAVCLLASTTAFSPVANNGNAAARLASTTEAVASSSSSSSSSSGSNTKDPLLIRAARGETVERTPVWMMRQAGRHISEYRDLCKQYPTFRQRSEIPEVAVEVSLQPWRNYQTDGCILFSDILTPLPGMGLEFSIDEKVGPVMEPIRNYEDAKKVRFCHVVVCLAHVFVTTFYSIFSQQSSPPNLNPNIHTQMHIIDPSTAAPFVAEALKTLRHEVGPETAVLGFVGCPYTLATYLVEGKTSREYLEIKKMAFNEPALLHQILKSLAESIGEYAVFQVENGAQLIQIFDSWAGHLSARDYDEFAAPYQKIVLDKVRS